MKSYIRMLLGWKEQKVSLLLMIGHGMTKARNKSPRADNTSSDSTNPTRYRTANIDARQKVTRTSTLNIHVVNSAVTFVTIAGFRRLQ
jgi:hypothetical protein